MANVTEGLKKDKFLVGSWFEVVIDGIPTKAVTDVSGISVEVDAVELSDQGGPGNVMVTRKTPGVAKYGEFTIKRMVTPDKTWYNWMKDLIDRGDEAYRHTAQVILLDRTMKPAAQWDFQNVWPSKWSVSDLDVGSNDPMTEELTIAYEHVKRTK
jgi:phage tail-like protein